MRHYLLITLIALGNSLLAGCSTPARYKAKLKEELKQELLAELQQQLQTNNRPSAQQDHEQMKQEIEREVLAKVHSRVQTISARLPDANERMVQWRKLPLGSAEGRILYNGKGLAGCKVKLVRIMKPQSVIEMFNIVREGAEFTTVTDDEGKYHFDTLPAGAYKLKWQLPDDKGWIRRLQDKPDVIIEQGRNAVLKAVETKRRLYGP